MIPSNTANSGVPAGSTFNNNSSNVAYRRSHTLPDSYRVSVSELWPMMGAQEPLHGHDNDDDDDGTHISDDPHSYALPNNNTATAENDGVMMSREQKNSPTKFLIAAQKKNPTYFGDSTKGEDSGGSSSHHPGDARGNGTSNLNWGRGIWKDYQRTVGTHWKGEMRNGNLTTIAVSFFLYFACMAPAITFGAIYEKATHNWIGAVEMITATAWCGIVYALIGGQPMMINGGTGPVLAFAESLYKMSVTLDVPFLTLNAWIGLWVAFYMMVAAVWDLNRILVYATRFTDEIFSFLISTIFIINAMGSPFAEVGIYYYFVESHKSHDEFEDDEEYYSYEATALLSLVVFLGTVYLAFMLRKAKFSPYFPNQLIRNIFTDFAVVISIFLMSLVANWVFKDIETESLNVPDSFAPTFSCCTADCRTNWPHDCPDQPEAFRQRPWMVDLFDLNGKSYVPFVAALPALLAFILVFLDDGITWHLINHPAHKLKHGAAFNYDTVIIGVMVAINSMLGLPWLVAATVRSLNHLHALATKSPDGKILQVQETRLTNLGIHLLCLTSIFALEVLKFIPVPVLYGVFLFMGLVSLGTNQFWGRLVMLFMQPSRYPREPHVEHVSNRSLHRFTILQLGLFLLLYSVKAIKTIAIGFPIIIALCIPFRVYILPKLFTEEELIMLDSDETAIQAYLATKQKLSVIEHEVDTDDGIYEVPSQPADDGPHDVADLITMHEQKEAAAKMEAEEGRDELSPLPQPRRRRRVKTVSCPVSGTMFGSSSMTGGTMSDTVSIKAHANDTVETETTVMVPETIPEHEQADHGDIETGAITSSATEQQQQQPRRRRHKTISCPPHMLFMEAERHVNTNYFFG